MSDRDEERQEKSVEVANPLNETGGNDAATVAQGSPPRAENKVEQPEAPTVPVPPVGGAQDAGTAATPTTITPSTTDPVLIQLLINSETNRKLSELRIKMLEEEVQRSRTANNSSKSKSHGSASSEIYYLVKAHQPLGGSGYQDAEGFFAKFNQSFRSVLGQVNLIDQISGLFTGEWLEKYQAATNHPDYLSQMEALALAQEQHAVATLQGSPAVVPDTGPLMIWFQREISEMTALSDPQVHKHRYGLPDAKSGLIMTDKDDANSFLRRWTVHVRQMSYGKGKYPGEDEWIHRAFQAGTESFRSYAWDSPNMEEDWGKWTQQWLATMMKDYQKSGFKNRSDEVKNLKAKLNSITVGTVTPWNSNPNPRQGGRGGNAGGVKYHRYDKAEFEEFKAAGVHLSDGKPIQGTDGVLDGFRWCKGGCNALGHFKQECPGKITGRVTTVTDYDAKFKIKYAYPPKGRSSPTDQGQAQTDALATAQNPGEDTQEAMDPTTDRNKTADARVAKMEAQCAKLMAEHAEMKAKLDSEVGDLREDVAFVALNSDASMNAISAKTRVHMAPIIAVNTNGTSRAMNAEPDDYGVVVMWDSGCGLSGVAAKAKHEQLQSMGRAGPVTPPDDLEINAAEGSGMGYIGNSWQDLTYQGKSLRVRVAVCEEYEGVLIVGNVAWKALKCKTDSDADIITLRYCGAEVHVPLQQWSHFAGTHQSQLLDPLHACPPPETAPETHATGNICSSNLWHQLEETDILKPITQEIDVIYTAKLPPAAVKKGYAAKGDSIHKDEFYQIPVKLQIDKKHPTRFFLAKHRKIKAKAAKAIA